MAINLNGSITSSAQLIADTGLLFGPLDAGNGYLPFTTGNNRPTQLSPGALPPTLTKIVPAGAVFPITVSAALEINSKLGGFLMPRMTLTERQALITTNGMQVYNITSDSVDMFIGGAWVEFASGSGLGNVVGPAGAVENNIATYGDNTGHLIKDSNISITQVPIVAATSISSLADATQIGNLGYIQFVSNQSPSVFVDALSPFNFIENDYGPGTQSSTIFTGGVPASGSSVSALVELDSNTGVLLLSRLTGSQLSGLPGLVGGMIGYNTTLHAMQVCQGSSPTWQSLGSVTSIGAFGFLTTDLVGGDPITQSGSIGIADSTPQRMLGFDRVTGEPTLVSVDGTTIVWGAGNVLTAVAAATGVTSVENLDGTLTISPINGDVIASVSATYPGNTSLHTLGTVTSGIWHGTRIDVSHGGTNATSFVDGSLIACAEDGTQLVSLASGSTSQVLISQGPDLLPIWVDFDAAGVSSITSSNGSLTVSTPTGNVNLELNVAGLSDFQLLALNGSGLLTSVTPGVANQVLISQGPGVLPIWGNQSGSGTVTAVTAAGGLTASPNPIVGTGTMTLANPGSFAAPNAATLFGAVIGGGNVTSTVNVGSINHVSNGGDINLFLGVDGFNTSSTTSLRNVGIGAFCLTAVTGFCSDNIAIGIAALTDLNSGAGQNIAMGTGSATVLVGGSANTILGHAGFNTATAGNGNVGLGANCGTGVLLPTNCSFLGSGATSSAVTVVNSTAVGAGAIVRASNQMVLGNNVAVGAGTIIGGLGPKYTLDLGNVSTLSPTSCGIRLAASTNTPATPVNTNDFVIFNNAGVPSYIDTSGVVHPIGGGAVDITGALNAGITVNPSPLIGTGTVAVTDLLLAHTGNNNESWFWGFQSGTVTSLPVVNQCIAIGAASLTNIYQATGGSGGNENGNRNIGIGANTLLNLHGGTVPGGGTIANDNIAIGTQSLANLEFLGGVTFSGDYSSNIGVGTFSLGNLNKTSIASGIFEAQGNIGVGTYAGTVLGAGSLNTFLGFHTGVPVGGVTGTVYQLDTCTLIGAEITIIPTGGGPGSGLTLIGANIGCTSTGGATIGGASCVIADANQCTAFGALAQIGDGADGATSLGAQTIIPSGATAATALGFRAQPNFPNSTAVGANVTVNVANACNIGDNQYVGINTDSPAYALDIATVAPGGVGTAISAIRLQSNGVHVPATPGSNNIVLYNSTNMPMVEYDDASTATLVGLTSISAGTFWFPKIVVAANGSITLTPDGFQDNANFNLFIGHDCGNDTLTGQWNTAVGISTANALTSGFQNTFFGIFNGTDLTSGSRNASFGYSALASLTTGSSNTAIGYSALSLLASGGSSNTAVGESAGANQVSYSRCTFLGYEADASVNGLTNAGAIGYQAAVGISNALVLGNGARVGVGQSSPIYTLDLGNISTLSPVSCGIRLAATTNTPSTPANTNDAVIFNKTGVPSYIDTSAITHILLNTFPSANNNMFAGFSGSNTGNASTTSLDCTALGFNALTSLTSGNYNTAFGSGCLNLVTNSARNTGVGVGALAQLVTVSSGADHTALGYLAMGSATAGFGSVAAGSLALSQAITADKTIAIGQGAGGAQLSYTNCTFVGYGADASDNALTNAAAIGANSVVGADNSLVLGGTGGNQVNVGIGTTTPKAMLHVAGGQIVNRTPVPSASSPYSVLVTDYIIGVTDTSSTVSIVLPAPSADNAGQVFIVKDESGGAFSHNISVTVTGGANIDNGSTFQLTVDYQSASFYSNGITYNIF